MGCIQVSRRDHGNIQADRAAQLDDGRISFSLGYSAQEQFQATLFEARGLDPNVDHRLVCRMAFYVKRELTVDVDQPAKPYFPSGEGFRRHFLVPRHRRSHPRSPPVRLVQANVLWCTSSLTHRSETLYTTVYDNNSTSISYDGVWTPVPEASLTTELGASFTFPYVSLGPGVPVQRLTSVSTEVPSS